MRLFIFQIIMFLGKVSKPYLHQNTFNKSANVNSFFGSFGVRFALRQIVQYSYSRFLPSLFLHRLTVVFPSRTWPHLNVALVICPAHIAAR